MLSSHNYSLHPHSGVLCTFVPHSSIKHSIHFVVPVSLAEKHEFLIITLHSQSHIFQS